MMSFISVIALLCADHTTKGLTAEEARNNCQKKIESCMQLSANQRRIESYTDKKTGMVKLIGFNGPAEPNEADLKGCL